MFTLPKDVICPNDTDGYLRLLPVRDKRRKDDSNYVRLYREKYDIINEQPVTRMLEIGVRAGYSAYTFKSAYPKAFYQGIDADNGTHGGEGRPWTWWAKTVLAKHWPLDTWDVVVMDTQKLSHIPGEPYDFIHVDGDHTAAGVYHDLEICWPALSPGGRMLVDDYTHLAKVMEGVDNWLAEHDVRHEFRQTVRGDVIIYKKP